MTGRFLKACLCLCCWSTMAGVSRAQEAENVTELRASCQTFISGPIDFNRWVLNDVAAGKEFAEFRKAFKVGSKKNWDSYSVPLEERNRLYRTDVEAAEALLAEKARNYDDAMETLRLDLRDQIASKLGKEGLRKVKQRWFAINFRKSGTRLFELLDAWNFLGSNPPVSLQSLAEINQNFWSTFEVEIEERIVEKQNALFLEEFGGLSLQEMLNDFNQK